MITANAETPRHGFDPRACGAVFDPRACGSARFRGQHPLAHPIHSFSGHPLVSTRFIAARVSLLT